MNSVSLELNNIFSPNNFNTLQAHLTTQPCFKSELQSKKSPLINKQSSIESIHKKRNIKSLFWNEECPLKVIKHHLNRSLEFSKRKQTTEEVRKKAYQFFQDQKSKISKKKKTGTYLLPKIYTKRNQPFGQNNQNFSSKNDLNQQKRKHKQMMGSSDEKLASQIHQKLKFFRDRCRQQMQKENITLKKQFTKKCFFDLSHQQIGELMNNQNLNNLETTIFKTQVNQSVEKRKFIPIEIQRQLNFEDNPSIPDFLLKRISMKKSNLFFDNTIQNSSLFFKKNSENQEDKRSLKIRRNKQGLKNCCSYENLT